MAQAFRRPAARRDLIANYVYLADNAGEAVADRFLARAEATFDDLLRQPMIGAPLKLRHPDLTGIRKWRVNDFDNHLIFYLPRGDGIVIVRVLHAAQDWWSLLGLDSER